MTDKDVSPGNVDSAKVIPANVPRKSSRVMRKTPAAPSKKVTQHTSSRKWQNIDYSKTDVGDDEPSPPLKKRKPNLLHKPSKTVLEAHKKCKMMSPLCAGRTATKMTTRTNLQEPVKALDENALPSTSTASTLEEPSIGTVTVSASAEETETAIAALLSLGSDLPQPDDDETVENSALVPINPVKHADRSDPVPSTSTSSNSGTDVNTYRSPYSVLGFKCH